MRVKPVKARIWGALFLLLGSISAAAGMVSGAGDGDRGAVVLTIDGAIGPASSDYFIRGVAKAAERGAPLVILRMDTPGGLDTSMRSIIREILAAPMPIATFVAPSGARAASAGTYILYASHVAAMAPGTNLGAATPVQIGGGGMQPPAEEQQQPRRRGRDDADTPAPRNDENAAASEDGGENDAGQPQQEEEAAGDDTEAPGRAGMSEKVIEDAVAYIRSLAQLRDRNPDWAEKAVREAASLSASDAAEMNVIDLIATDVRDLLDKLDGREVTVQGVSRTLETADLPFETLEPDWRTQFLAIITNPNVAYILMLIGIYGILFEFYSPGLVGPGVIGGISLILALYAFQILPVNYGGLALTLLGVALIIAETVTPAFGILGIGGIAAFVLGSVMLIDTDVPGFEIAWELIGGVALVASILLLTTLTMLMRARNRAVVSGMEQMIGSTGEVRDWSETQGSIMVHGERWRARSDLPLVPGQSVKVIKAEGLTLDVRPEPETERR
jgi:membrane-bound serine protease (ClpP class)